MKVKVSYVWDSETNTYSSDDSDVGAVLEPNGDDRMVWKVTTTGRRPASVIMPLTRGFEMLPYLAGLARDAVVNAEKLNGNAK